MAVLKIINLPFRDFLLQAFYELFNFFNCALDRGLSSHKFTPMPGVHKQIQQTAYTVVVI